MPRKPKPKPITHCQTCGKLKKLPTHLQKGVPMLAYEIDPYCSRTCVPVEGGT